MISSFDKLMYKELYDQFDSGHNWSHVEKVAVSARYLAEIYAIEMIDIINIAAYVHDIGLCYGRDLHEIYGSEMVYNDLYLKTILTIDQIKLVADAVLNHRASTGNPINIVSMIISDADRIGEFSAKGILIRTFNYSSMFFDNIDDRLKYAINHVMEKFITGGSRYKIPVIKRCHFKETKNRLEEMTNPIIELFKIHNIDAIRQFIEV